MNWLLIGKWLLAIGAALIALAILGFALIVRIASHFGEDF